MHWPLKQMSFVQVTPSSQSACAQHSAQSPPAQHFSLPAHMGEASQTPSALQRSRLQASLSLQSSGPLQGILGAAPIPTLPPALEPLLPALEPLPPALDPPLPPCGALSKAGPEQALINTEGKSARHPTKSAYLGLKLTTDLLCKVSLASIAARADSPQKACIVGMFSADRAASGKIAY
jgi:hypothetical protein